MRIAVTTYATKSFLYALEEVAGLVLAAVQYAGITDWTWVIATDESEEAKAAHGRVARMLRGVDCRHIEVLGTTDNATGKHVTESNITIARLQAAAWHEARLMEADAVWSVEADVLPMGNTLQCLLDTLRFDRGWYDVSMAAYPNDAFLGGYGTPTNWILPSVYDDEREDKKEGETEGKPKGNVFELQSKGWRRRGWLESAHPGVGLGAILPSGWVGLGCTLISRRALSLANWVGYTGAGTQDLWLCWKCWHPAGVRMAVVPHAVCSHLKRRDGKMTLMHAYHEQAGECAGHLRMRKIEKD